MNKHSTIGILIGDTSERWQRIDADGNSLSMSTADFDAHPIFGQIQDAKVDGQEMVSVPWFCYRTGKVEAGEHAGKDAVWICPIPAPGFQLHPAFRHDGGHVIEFLVGKYQSSLDGELLASKEDAIPAGSISLEQARMMSSARGDGWMVWSVYQLAAIQLLAMIEHGSSIFERGGIEEAQRSDVRSMRSYRGIENLWRDAWQFVDGLQTTRKRTYCIWLPGEAGTFVDTGVAAPPRGWMKEFAAGKGEGFDLAGLFLPLTTFKGRVEDSPSLDTYFGADPSSYAIYGALGPLALNVGVRTHASYSGWCSRLAVIPV